MHAILQDLTHTNAHELLPAYAALPLQIKLLNHSHQLLLLKRLAQLPRHAPQILQRDLALIIGIEQRERAQDLVARIPLRDQPRRHRLEPGQRQEQPPRRHGRRLLPVLRRRQGVGRDAVRGQQGEDLVFRELET